MFSGGSDGKVQLWKGASPGKSVANNKGAIHSIATFMKDKEEKVIVGGNDKTITIYNFSGGNLK